MDNNELTEKVRNLVEKNKELEAALDRVIIQTEIYGNAGRYFKACKFRKKGTALNQIIGRQEAYKTIAKEMKLVISGEEQFGQGWPFDPH